MSMPEGLAENLLADLRRNYLAQLPNRVDDIEQIVLDMENGGDYAENYETLYRHVHSLKGSGGVYGFSMVTAIGHQFEDYLALMDKNYSRGAPINVDLMLGYVDVLRDVCDAFQQSSASLSSVEASLSALKKRATPNHRSGLIVESSPLHVSLIKEVLSEYPVQLSTAKEGVSALHRLMTECFDFIITSQEVGELNGSALLAALRLSRSVNRHSKVIILSSNRLDELPKQFQPDALIKKDSHMQANIDKAVQEIFAAESLTA